jgi:hypothetical protein
MEIDNLFETVLAQTTKGFADASAVIAGRCDGRGFEMCFTHSRGQCRAT